MNETEQGIASYLGDDRLAYLQSVTIGIAGAGGLGSNCAVHLVRSGFRRLIIADYDRVEPSNLNRQFFFAHQIGKLKVEALAENLRAINPDVDLSMHPTKLGADSMAELFTECHAVVEALDDPATKKTLTEKILPTGKLLVAASGMGGCGRADAIKTSKLRDNFILVGDMETECNADTPPLSPMVAVAAAKQADALLYFFLTQFEENKT